LYLSAAAESHTERTTISLRLCALARRKKKILLARKDAKPQSPPQWALEEEKKLIPPIQKPGSA
jgi:hypothetical protein